MRLRELQREYKDKDIFIGRNSNINTDYCVLIRVDGILTYRFFKKLKQVADYLKELTI